jgi:hypothetical protein
MIECYQSLDSLSLSHSHSLCLAQLLALEADVLADRYLAPHCAFFMREFRVLAFKQFLEAYKR